jgi:hypothetical protein
MSLVSISVYRLLLHPSPTSAATTVCCSPSARHRHARPIPHQALYWDLPFHDHKSCLVCKGSSHWLDSRCVGYRHVTASSLLQRSCDGLVVGTSSSYATLLGHYSRLPCFLMREIDASDFSSRSQRAFGRVRLPPTYSFPLHNFMAALHGIRPRARGSTGPPRQKRGTSGPLISQARLSFDK